MAFLKSSRYYGLPTVEVETRQGRTVSAVKLRVLPVVSGTPHRVQENDRLDLMANTTYKDATRFWRIADANSELEANELIHADNEIEVPRSE